MALAPLFSGPLMEVHCLQPCRCLHPARLRHPFCLICGVRNFNSASCQNGSNFLSGSKIKLLILWKCVFCCRHICRIMLLGPRVQERCFMLCRRRRYCAVHVPKDCGCASSGIR